MSYASRQTMVIVGLLAIACLLSTGCAAFRPIHGVPARYLPEEMRASGRSGKRTIDLSLMAQTPPQAYLVDTGDVLAVYIEKFLGRPDQALPVQLPTTQSNEFVPSLGFPLPVRDDGTISLPEVGPLMVRGQTIRQVEQTVRKAVMVDRKILQPHLTVAVSLQRPRLTRVLVVRQESPGGVQPVAAAGQINLGALKRGTGKVVFLPAYHNDVMHALAETGGLPGLDAENAIYVIRARTIPGYQYGTPGAAPQQHLSSAFPNRNRPASEPVIRAQSGEDNSRAFGQYDRDDSATPARRGHTYGFSSPAEEQAPSGLLGPVPTGGRASHAYAGRGDDQVLSTKNPSRPSAGFGPPAVQPPGYDSSQVAPQYNQPGHSPGGVVPVSASQFAAPGAPGLPLSNGGPIMMPPQAMMAPIVPEAVAPPTGPWPGYQPPIDYSLSTMAPVANPTGNAELPPVGPGMPAMAPADPYAGWQGGPYSQPGMALPNFAALNDESLNTVDNPRIVRIPVRLGPNESVQFAEQDILLHDGDIVFVESRDTEVFYTGGLLGGGQYTLPRDYDVDVLHAIAISQGLNRGGGGTATLSSVGGQSALNGDVSISASTAVVLRPLADGSQVPIRVDLYRALRNPSERIIIQPGDYILLQYTPIEAIGAFVERHILAGALFGLAAAQLQTTRN